MSKLKESTRLDIKEQVFNTLTDKYKSTYSVQKEIGRSWKFTYQVLNQLFEERRIMQIKVGHLTFWWK